MANERLSIPRLSGLYADEFDIDKEVFKKLRLSKSFVMVMAAIFQTVGKKRLNAFNFRSIRSLCPFKRNTIYDHLSWLVEVKLLQHTLGEKEPYSLLAEDFQQIILNMVDGEVQDNKGILFTMKNLIQLKESLETFQKIDEMKEVAAK